VIILSKVPESTDMVFKQLEMASELERVRFELTGSNISVKFLQDFSGFSFENINIPFASKGSQIDVPYFIAEILRKKSVIEDFRMNFLRGFLGNLFIMSMLPIIIKMKTHP